MIIINLTGGLGNQMYQYAFGRYVSIKHKTKLKYHFTNALFNTQREFSLDVFNIQASVATDSDLKEYGVNRNNYFNRVLYLLDERYGIQFNKNIITQRIPYIFNESLRNCPNNRYIQGYFADERFFKGIEDIILKDFTSKKPLDQKNIKIIGEIKQTNSVSIHVRRGDLVSNKANSISNGFIGLDYYIYAINKIKKTISYPHFYVFSDDIPWCKENLTMLIDDASFINHNTGTASYKDLLLMKECKHNILANSTFSRWSAYLNSNKNKVIITPSSYYSHIKK
jgi:hypothetical protein